MNPTHAGSTITRAYRGAGYWLHAHAGKVLIASLLVIAAAWPFARVASSRLDPGSEDIAGSGSARVAAAMQRDFSNPFLQSLAVTFHSDTSRADAPGFQRALGRLAEALGHSPLVSRVLLPGSPGAEALRSVDGQDAIVLIGLQADSSVAAQRTVPEIRALIRAILAGDELGAWQWNVTGQPAFLYDLGELNARDAARAELRALPLTLIALLLVFGSPGSAVLPLALGVASITLAMSLVPGLTHAGPINVLYENTVSLLGLALGIDYALFMVSRYRELRRRMESADALAETMAKTGVAVTYSGLTVIIGLTGLLFTPLSELRAMGMGGVAVVSIGVLLALTLVPALLALTDRWLFWPRRREQPETVGSRWENWTRFVLRRPGWSLAFSLVFLLALSAPLLGIRAGFPDRNWLPRSLETSRGLDVLEKMHRAQEVTPIYLLLRPDSATSFITERYDALRGLSAALRRDPRVARVLGPLEILDSATESEQRFAFSNLELAITQAPQLDWFFSRDRHHALVQVVLKDSLGYQASLAATRDLAALRISGLSFSVGGRWSASNDFDCALLAAYPVVCGGVVLVTFVVLLCAFRSLLVPVKAVLLNALSVAASIGATIAVFQWGWGAHWFGTEPAGAIPLHIPLIVFCVTFGLSMDYHVLILSRVREEYEQCRDTSVSIVKGVGATGGLVTGAAAIMAVVFVSFAEAEILIVKMLGFSLFVAVVLDAFVVRAVTVPAAMKLAGRWNWRPGLK